MWGSKHMKLIRRAGRYLRRRAEKEALYLASFGDARHYRQLFSEVESCCLFIGYPRSGHSLVGSLLNAHRHVVISHELNLAQFVRRWSSEEQLFTMLLKRDEWFEQRGRSQSGYDYRVPGQWQGRFEAIRVIGDKKGGGTTALLTRSPPLLRRLQATLSRPLRFIHVLRNPFDNIATIYRRDVDRGRRPADSLSTVVRDYFSSCAGNMSLTESIGADRVHHLRLEDLIRAPHQTLASLCGSLGLDAPEDYLQACGSILFPQARKTRQTINWPSDLLGTIEARIEALPLLAGYSYTS